MLVIETPAAMRAWSDDQHRQGRTIALVPTMGALHDGHLQLIDEGATRCDLVVVSIFVNRLQFNRDDDFQQYPRRPEDDAATCDRRGVAVVYTPRQDAMYPRAFQTHVEPGALSEPLEGAGRPGHFRGVATVVTKLFNAVRPEVAVFGRKDFQQLTIVTRMAADLDTGIEVVGLDTVREPDGLAMSSRNQRLDAEQRRAAVVVPAALVAIQAAARARALVPSRDTGASFAARLAELCDVARAVVAGEPLVRLEYVEIVDPSTLRAPESPDVDVVALIAVWFGHVRLIDNCALGRISP